MSRISWLPTAVEANYLHIINKHFLFVLETRLSGYPFSVAVVSTSLLILNNESQENKRLEKIEGLH